MEGIRRVSSVPVCAGLSLAEMPGGQAWGWSSGWCGRQLPLGDVALAPGPGGLLAVKLIRHQCTLCFQALDWAVASGQPWFCPSEKLSWMLLAWPGTQPAGPSPRRCQGQALCQSSCPGGHGFGHFSFGTKIRPRPGSAEDRVPPRVQN